MRTLLLLICLCLFSCKVQERTEFIYTSNKKALLRELKLSLDADVIQIEQSLKAYFNRFDKRLKFTLDDKALKVNGPEDAIKVFEYLYLTMFDDEHKLQAKVNITDSISGEKLEKTFLLESYGEQVFEREDSELRGVNLKVSRSDELTFIDRQNLDFTLYKSSSNKVQQIHFSSIFQNGDKDSFYYKLPGSDTLAQTDISGSVQVTWQYLNSHFFTSLGNFIPLGSDREIAVMPILNQSNLEDTIRSHYSSIEKGLSFEALFRKYLKGFGIELSKIDILRCNIEMNNILLVSSKKNSEMFRQIMSPLSHRYDKKIQLEGEVLKGSDSVAVFSFPVRFNTESVISANYENILNKDSLESEELELMTKYSGDWLSNKVFLETDIEYSVINKMSDVDFNMHNNSEIKKSTEHIVDSNIGLMMKLEMINYTEYE